MTLYVEFVGGPLDGALQRWPDGQPGREISLPPVSRPIARRDPSHKPRRAIYCRSGEEQPYGASAAVKVTYEFKELAS